MQKKSKMSISQRIAEITTQLPSSTKLVAVSKFHPKEAILEAYQGGQRIFGESKVQELTDKFEQLPKDIQWHFIGHLQTNKIKYIVPFVDLIHGVDSYKLLQAINKEAAKQDRTVDILLQIHIAREESKFGFSAQECREMLESGEWKTCSHLRIRGLMGMATFTDDQDCIRKEFRSLATLYKELKSRYFTDKAFFDQLSMGMSDDYHIAIEEGSTLIRIGSSIFGQREY